MNITVFLLCHNESVLLPHTVCHYRKILPSCEIIIHDNMSTDGSKELAEFLGCKVIYFDTKDIMDTLYQTNLKNNCWKNAKKGWVIVCDMDEWLCVDENDLIEENKLGNTILNTIGYEIVAQSEVADLSDISLHELSHGIRNNMFDKKICFNSEKINAINFAAGAHSCNPNGVVKSSGEYLFKHMNYLGLPYILRKNKVRYDRSHKNRTMGMSIHYREDENLVKNNYKDKLNKTIDLKEICSECFF